MLKAFFWIDHPDTFDWLSRLAVEWDTLTREETEHLVQAIAISGTPQAEELLRQFQSVLGYKTRG
jgi:hypothetical protein